MPISKRLVKTLRKRQACGMKGDSTFQSQWPPEQQCSVPDLFSKSSGNADWYFNNASLKSKG